MKNKEYSEKTTVTLISPANIQKYFIERIANGQRKYSLKTELFIKTEKMLKRVRRCPVLFVILKNLA